MKKFMAMLLALVMVLGLVACGSGDSGAGSNNSGEKVVKIGVFEPSPATTAQAASRKCWACSMPTA